MRRLDENEIIRIFAFKLGIASLDDVAVLSLGGNRIAFKCDMLVKSTDVPPRMQAWQVARKSVVSCVSDLSAKGIRPHAAMVSLGLPRGCSRKYIEGLAQGFKIAAREFGFKIAGGDTNESGELVIDCSMIGTVDGTMPPRSGARPRDALVVSGMFGLAPAGLAILTKKAKAQGKFRKQAVDSVLKPAPRQRFGIALAKYFSSSIDSSDGLAISLYELAKQSKVDIVIDNVPAHSGLDEFAKENKLDVRDLVFHGGEEYEIVATIPRSKLSAAKAAVRKSRPEFHIIGRVQKGRGRVFLGDGLLENRGYVHFG